MRSRFQSGGQLSNLKVDTPTLSPLVVVLFPDLLLSIISSRHVMAFSTALQSDALNSRVVLQVGYLRSPEIRVIRKANEDYDSTLRYSLFQSANYTVRLLYRSKVPATDVASLDWCLPRRPTRSPGEGAKSGQKDHARRKLYHARLCGSRCPFYPFGFGCSALYSQGEGRNHTHL